MQARDLFLLASWPESMTFTLAHSGSELIFSLTKNLSCSCKRAMNTVPGVIQLLSKRFSEGSVSPEIFKGINNMHSIGIIKRLVASRGFIRVFWDEKYFICLSRVKTSFLQNFTQIYWAVSEWRSHKYSQLIHKFCFVWINLSYALALAYL